VVPPEMFLCVIPDDGFHCTQDDMELWNYK